MAVALLEGVHAQIEQKRAVGKRIEEAIPRLEVRFPGAEAQRSRWLSSQQEALLWRNGRSPDSGLGLCLAVDLIFHGFAWISYALAVPAKQVPQTA